MQESKVYDIKPKPILHIIVKDWDLGKEIEKLFEDIEKRDSTFLKDYYVFYSTKGAMEMKVINGLDIETLEYDDEYEPDKDAMKCIVESEGIIDKIKRLLGIK